MSLENIKLPFLAIGKLPDKFRVAVTGNSEEKTKYTKDDETQKVIHVLLEDKEGQIPTKGSPPNHFLALSNHAQKSLRAKGFKHLDELTRKIVHFRKAEVEGFTAKTIEVTKVEEW